EVALPPDVPFECGDDPLQDRSGDHPPLRRPPGRAGTPAHLRHDLRRVRPDGRRGDPPHWPVGAVVLQSPAPADTAGSRRLPRSDQPPPGVASRPSPPTRQTGSAPPAGDPSHGQRDSRRHEEHGLKRTFDEAVLEVLRRLQPGEVVTYGEVAEEAGFPGAARAVGTLLRRTGEDVPWWRVVASGGHLRATDRRLQTDLLRGEGVVVRRGRVVSAPGPTRQPTG